MGVLEKILASVSSLSTNIFPVDEPRKIIGKLGGIEVIEMSDNKKSGLCCGAGGAQMFKEVEPGDKRINIERAEEALAENPSIIAANCPFCITMLQDGVKSKDLQDKVMVLDLSEMIVNQL